MFAVRVRFREKLAEIYYDPLLGYDVLEIQLTSLFQGLSNVCLLDFAGRKMLSNDDIEDVKVVEIRAEEPFSDSVSDNASVGDMGWEQHVDLDQSNVMEERRAGVVRSGAVVDIWVLEGNTCHYGNFCSRNVFPHEPILQPAYRVIDTPFILCGRCHQALDSSLVTQVTSEIVPFICDSHKLFDVGFLSIEGQTFIEHNASIFTRHELEAYPIQMYFKRLLLHHAILNQPSHSIIPSIIDNEHNIEQRIQKQCQSVLHYEDPQLQAEARSVINFDRLRFRAQEYLSEVPDAPQDVAFLQGLLRWFKHEFFTWINKPGCSTPGCDGKPPNLDAQGAGMPTTADREGWASMIEIYKCNLCNQLTRFPRYNNSKTLLKSRRGRCGEWANCFVLICRSLALDARYVLDFTDHVWAEVWVPSLRRYVHCDPCEKRMDTPLMYEAGWNKKLTYIFSISRHGVIDAMPRYTRKLNEVLQRRNPVSERYVQEIIRKYDDIQERWYINNHNSHNNHNNNHGISSRMSNSSLNLDTMSLNIYDFEQLAAADISVMTMRRRKRLLLKEMAAVTLVSGHEWKLEELQGRISGDKNWKIARGEIGTQQQQQVQGHEINTTVTNRIVSTTNTSSNIIHGTQSEIATSTMTTTIPPKLLVNAMDTVPWMLPGLQTSTSALSKGYIDIVTCSMGSNDNIDTCGNITSLHGSTSTSTSTPMQRFVGNVPVCCGYRGHNVNKYLDHSDIRLCPVESDVGLTLLVEDEELSHGQLQLQPQQEHQQQDQQQDQIEEEESNDDVDEEVEVEVEHTESAIVVVNVLGNGEHCGRGIRRLMKSLGDHQVLTGRPSGNESWLIVSSPGGHTSPTYHSLNAGYGPAYVRVRCVLATEQIHHIKTMSPSASTSTAPSMSMSMSISPQLPVDSSSRSSEPPISLGITISLKCVNGYICSVPSLILSKENSNDNFINLQQKATSLCLSQSHFLGYVSLVSAGLILLFGDTGYPLQPCNGAQIYLKTAERMKIQPPSVNSTANMILIPPSIPSEESKVENSISSMNTTSGIEEEKETYTATTTNININTTDDNNDNNILINNPPMNTTTTSSTTTSSSNNTTSNISTITPITPFRSTFSLSNIPRSHSSSSSIKSLSSVEQTIAMKYIPLSGAHHEDTVEELWTRLQLQEIICYAGSDYVNGVRCIYSTSIKRQNSTSTSISDISEEKLVFPSPLFTSNHDSPSPNTLTIATGDAIQSICIYSGNVVDSVVMKTKKGVVWRAGGSGGTPCEEVFIPEGWRFIGFYGVSVSVSRSLWTLTFQHHLWELPLLTHCQHLMEHHRHSLIGKLLALILDLIRSNNKADTTQYFQTYASYLSNLVKDPNGSKTRKIRLGNEDSDSIEMD
eukprot:gene4003-7977_t